MSPTVLDNRSLGTLVGDADTLTDVAWQTIQQTADHSLATSFM